MKFDIKLFFDFDEKEYVVYIDGIKNVEGRGQTEIEAIDNFKEKMNKKFDKFYDNY